MNEFSHDILARRLATLEFEEPDPHVISARVLARASARRTSGRPAAFALAPVLLVGLTLSGTYFAPVFSQALADGPIGTFAGGLLRGSGLASRTDRITAMDDRVTATGITLELVGGYADGARTLILVRTVPAAYPAFGSTPPVLRDQFGQTYRALGAGGTVETGETVLDFGPLRWPASGVGARLSLEIGHLLVGGTTEVSGEWTTHGTLAVDEGVDLASPAAIDAGGLHFTFTRVRSYPTVVAVDFRVSGATELLAQRVSDAGKGAPFVDIALIDAAGGRLAILRGDLSGGPEMTGRWLFQTGGPAPHTLRITVSGAQSVERLIGP